MQLAIALTTDSLEWLIAYQSVPMTVDCFALITIAISLIHKVTHRGAEPSNTRGLLTFGVLFLMGLRKLYVYRATIHNPNRTFSGRYHHHHSDSG
jgi:hypothetical protein